MNKAQFFQYLENGGKIKMISFHGEPVPSNHKLATIRQAEKVQSNAIKFTGGSWLYKSEVKASEVTEVAAGNNIPAVSIGWAVYQLVGDK
jgi:hypothetical protein